MLHQLVADGAVDNAAELTDFAGLVFESVPPVRPFAEEGECPTDRPIEQAQSQHLPGMAALVGQYFTGAGGGHSPDGGAAVRIADAARGHFHGALARSRLAHLFAQHFLSEIPADGDDFCRPGDAGAAKEIGRPTAVVVAAVCGVNADETPGALAAGFAVDLKAGPAAQTPHCTGRQSREHSTRIPVCRTSKSIIPLLAQRAGGHTRSAATAFAIR